MTGRIVLNLGSGGVPAPADVVDGGREIRVDICQPADVVADVRAMPFDDGYADAVYTSHLLEHFAESETVSVLQEWRRVLKPGGTLIVLTPDVQSTAARIATDGIDAVLYITRDGLQIRSQDVIFGYQPWVARNASMRHLVAFDAAKMSGVLRQAGFSKGQVEQNVSLFSLRATAVK